MVNLISSWKNKVRQRKSLGLTVRKYYTSKSNLEFENVEMSNNVQQEEKRVWMCQPHG